MPGGFHGQRRLAVYSPWGCKNLDRTELLNTHTSAALHSAPRTAPGGGWGRVGAQELLVERVNELSERRGCRLVRRREELMKGAGGFVTVSKGTGRTNARGQSKGVRSYGRLLSWRGRKIRALFQGDARGQDSWPG